MKTPNRKHYLLVLFSWTLLIGSLLIFELYNINEETNNDATIKARTNFNKDHALRSWAALHGGVYVPIDSLTPPNPSLSHVIERDIETPSGKKLTLMNPAYLVRQYNDFFTKNYGIVGHITSKKLLRPENKADAWELEVLNQFEKGEKEVKEYSIINGEPYLRLMQPLFIEQSCLKCHEHQGYKVGDVRGGISVSLPMQSILKSSFQKKIRNTLAYLFVWAVGFIGIFYGYKTLKESFEIQEHIKLALQENELKLIESNNTKDKFLTIIAHDLKSPFNSILGFSKLLNDNFEQYDSEKQLKFLRIIHKGMQNSYNLLENLLTWTRLQKGVISFNPTKINLQLITNETIELFGQLANNKAVKLTNKIVENIFVEADRNMLSTVLRNLLSNAIKFTPKGGNIIVNTIPNLEENENFVTIAITDNGVGISKEVVPNLFEIAKNTSTAGTEKEIGTGLGLILCKEFIEKHGGEIWVESEVGKGSTFKFTIPIIGFK